MPATLRIACGTERFGPPAAQAVYSAVFADAEVVTLAEEGAGGIISAKVALTDWAGACMAEATPPRPIGYIVEGAISRCNRGASDCFRRAHLRRNLRMPWLGKCQTLHGTSSYQRLARGRLSAVLLIGLYHLRTIRLSAHIWLAVTTRCAARSQNISDKAFKRSSLMCHRAGKNCIIQPWCLMVPN